MGPGGSRTERFCARSPHRTVPRWPASSHSGFASETTVLRDIVRSHEQMTIGRRVRRIVQITRARRDTRGHARSLVRTVALERIGGGENERVRKSKSAVEGPESRGALRGGNCQRLDVDTQVSHELPDDGDRLGSATPGIYARISAYALAGRTSASRRACPMAATAAAWCASLASSSAMTTLASRTTIATLDGASAAFPSQRRRSAGPRSWPRPPRRG